MENAFLFIVKKPPWLNCTPKVRQKKSNFWGAVHVQEVLFLLKDTLFEGPFINDFLFCC